VGDSLLIHLTDLHVHRRSASEWLEPAEETFRQLARSNQVVGLAITGDLLNSPSKRATAKLNVVLERLLVSLGLSTDNPSETRLFTVDGNHDFKHLGNVHLPSPFRSGSSHAFPWGGKTTLPGLSLFGLDSAADPVLARGTVTKQQLLDMMDWFRAQPRGNSHVVLVHHHLLPLPKQVQAHVSLRDIAQDESTMLLSNAGAVLAALLEARVDIVLHGHRHDQHISRYIEYEHEPDGRHLVVTGATRASQGFQIVRFRDDGHVELERFTRGDAAYHHHRPGVRILSRDEVNVAEWKVDAAESGHYEVLRTHARLTPAGDMIDETFIQGIRGGRIPIESIELEATASDHMIGACEFNEVRHLQTNQLAPGLPPPGFSISYRCDLGRRIDADGYDAGIMFRRTGINTYAVGAEESELRRLEQDEELGYVERFTRTPRRPVLRMIVTLAFPRADFLPSPKLARLDVVDNETGEAAPRETARAREHFHCLLEDGLVVLDLPHVRPTYQYRISWGLPMLRASTDPVWRHRIERTKSIVDRIPRPIDAETRTRVRELTTEVRNRLLQKNPLRPTSGANGDDLELALVLLEEQARELTTAAATYDEASPLWTVKMPWGKGITGTAMRRGRPAFHDRQASDLNRVGLYHREEGVPADMYFLAVPVELAQGGKPLPEVPPLFYRAAMVLRTTQTSSSLARCSLTEATVREVAKLLIAEAPILAESLLTR
jgi:predicted phosphodiesterase